MRTSSVGCLDGPPGPSSPRSATDSVLYGGLWGLTLVAVGAALAWSVSGVLDIEIADLVLALTPGGLPEMSLVALGIGADVAFVVTCSLVRFLAVVLAVPALFSRLGSPVGDPLRRSGNGRA